MTLETGRCYLLLALRTGGDAYFEAIQLGTYGVLSYQFWEIQLHRPPP